MTKEEFPYWSEEETMNFLNYNETSMRNLRNSKALTRYQIGNRFFYDNKEIAKLIKVSKVSAFNSEALSKFAKSMNKQISNTELKIIQKQFILENAKLFLKRINETFLDTLKYPNETELNKKDNYILLNCIENNGDFESVAKKLNITKERVKQIFEKASRRVFTRINWGRREFDRITNKNQELVDENIVLREQNRLLVQQLNVISSQLKTINNLNENSKEKSKDIEVNIDILKILSTPIIDLNLSVRSYNCLKETSNPYNRKNDFEIKTLGDILHHYKNKNLLKIRNFGRKSFTELEDILVKYGLIDYYGNILI